MNLKSRFLHRAATPQEVRQAINECKGFGKRLPMDFYIHKSCVGLLPPVLRELLDKAIRYAQHPDFDLVKFAKTGYHITFLRYPDFDSNPHPGLVSSVRVSLETGQCTDATYSAVNPPILHRKETFVAPDYPGADKFRALTAQEQAAGLLGRNDIGYRQRWEDFLRAQGFTIRDYELVRV